MPWISPVGSGAKLWARWVERPTRSRVAVRAGKPRVKHVLLRMPGGRRCHRSSACGLRGGFAVDLSMSDCCLVRAICRFNCTSARKPHSCCEGVLLDPRCSGGSQGRGGFEATGFRPKTTGRSRMTAKGLPLHQSTDLSSWMRSSSAAKDRVPRSDLVGHLSRIQSSCVQRLGSHHGKTFIYQEIAPSRDDSVQQALKRGRASDCITLLRPETCLRPGVHCLPGTPVLFARRLPPVERLSPCVPGQTFLQDLLYRRFSRTFQPTSMNWQIVRCVTP